jgi:crossover junction endodeoxyribonuclease RuvC
MIILGVDPGINGGLAVVNWVPATKLYRLVTAIDIPTVGIKAKQRVDIPALAKFVQEYEPDHALIERAQAMPSQGSSSGFKYGRAVGAIEAVIECYQVPLTIIEASMWKKFHGIARAATPSLTKEAGRQRALQLFPEGHSFLARKMDHGRGEAALIALYYVKVLT